MKKPKKVKISLCPYMGSEVIDLDPMTFDQFLDWSTHVEAALTLASEPTGSKLFRRLFFQIFDGNESVEKAMFAWLEAFSPKTSGEKIPSILKKMVYAIGSEAFYNKKLAKSYFPGL